MESVKKALIAMSGGVDSSVAAFLAMKEGYDCVGITMKLFDNEMIHSDRSCCSLDDIKYARNAAEKLGIPFYINNFSDSFREDVIEPFIASYKKGNTPNPCIDCNRYVKFNKLLLRARQLDMDYFITGHYARVEFSPEKGRWLLKKALDSEKDQSYVLYVMTQEQLSHTLFPLGTLQKTDVRKIAKEQSFNNADKKESQDICFVPEGSYAEFIEKFSGIKNEEGNFVDLNGNILGRHRGFVRYTIGQRRGLGISLNKPMYVHSKNLEKNTIILCEDEDLFFPSLNAVDFNFIAIEKLEEPIRVKVKIRYNQEEQWATVSPSASMENAVHIQFDEPQRAITSGQAAVLYDGDIVVGGGTIA